MGILQNQDCELTLKEQLEIATDLLAVAAQGAECGFMHSVAPCYKTALFNEGCAQIFRRPGAE